MVTEAFMIVAGIIAVIMAEVIVMGAVVMASMIIVLMMIVGVVRTVIAPSVQTELAHNASANRCTPLHRAPPSAALGIVMCTIYRIVPFFGMYIRRYQYVLSIQAWMIP